MFPIEDFRFPQQFSHWSRKPFAWRVSIFAEIGMMNESFAAGFQFGSKFAQVRFDHLAVQMYESIEAKYEIDRSVWKHR